MIGQQQQRRILGWIELELTQQATVAIIQQDIHFLDHTVLLWPRRRHGITKHFVVSKIVVF
jgi:hypothetical protein